VIYVISQIKFNIGLNPKFIRNGFFVVKIVGILFQSKVITHMAEQESRKRTNISFYLENNFILK